MQRRRAGGGAPGGRIRFRDAVGTGGRGLSHGPARPRRCAGRRTGRAIGRRAGQRAGRLAGRGPGRVPRRGRGVRVAPRRFGRGTRARRRRGRRRGGCADRAAPDPPVAAIRGRALERVGLAVGRAEGLWQGLRRRALLPSLELRGGYDVDQGRGHSRDQTYVSGDTRELFDRDRDEGLAYRASFVLDWELGGLAYPEDAVDLSRELRQVTSLRDDVSDEIHQLYFERQRIRARLAQPDALAPGESVELRLRAEELDAGLDAWTGGWISAWRASRVPAQPIHPRRSEHAID